MTKTALVTGAFGFLGRHTARRFASEGYVVSGIGHGRWLSEEWKTWGLSTWQEADVSLAALTAYGGRTDVIVHCAGSGSVAFSERYPLEDFERTVVTTAHILEYIRSFSPGSRLVYPSSASVYGAVDALPIKENVHAAPVSPYGVHKLMAEQLVASASRQSGICASIVRLFSVYGCGLRKQLLWDACSKFAAGNNTFMGTGKELRDWLHVEDAAALLLTASNFAANACPIINGGSGEGVAVHDVLLRLYSRLGAKTSPVFSGTPRAGDPPRYVASIENAARWQWQPSRPWRDGVDEYADWWLVEGTGI
jgi:UDP-glucose 4-epimerase